jgi:hypothetical protein
VTGEFLLKLISSPRCVCSSQLVLSTWKDKFSSADVCVPIGNCFFVSRGWTLCILPMRMIETMYVGLCNSITLYVLETSVIADKCQYKNSHSLIMLLLYSGARSQTVPNTVAARSKAWTVFVRSNAGIVGSNPTQGMDVYVCVYSMLVLFSVYR